jgi:hypothetical protein
MPNLSVQWEFFKDFSFVNGPFHHAEKQNFDTSTTHDNHTQDGMGKGDIPSRPS